MPLNSDASLRDVIDLLSELQGINQKAELASVIGLPATSSETIAQQIPIILQSKEILSNNLNSKGVFADNSESLLDLSTKVSNIRYAEDFVTGTSRSSTGTSLYFQHYGSLSQSSLTAITVSLNFKPSRIEVVSTGLTNNYHVSHYYDNFFEINDCVLVSFHNTGSTSSVSVTNYTFKANAQSGYVRENGFRLPVLNANTDYIWKAYR